MSAPSIAAHSGEHRSAKKSVLFVVGTLGLGGIERQVADLCIALQQSGKWSPAMCCLIAREGPYLSVLSQHNIPVYECKLNARNLTTFVSRFARLVRQVNPDVLHSHVAFSLPWQVFGARLGGARAIVITQQNEYPQWEANPLALLRIRLYYRLSRPFIAAYTTISLKVRSQLARMVARPEAEFPVIYNSVDVDKFSNSPQARKLAREELGVDSTRFVVGNVARLVEQKGHIYLLQAAEIVKHTDPDIDFIIVGDGPLRESLENLARDLGLQGNMFFLGQRTNVQRIFPGFDCFVLPSLWEGGPIVLTEAMACEIPVVSTQVGMAREALEGDCGLLTPPADSSALAEAILFLKYNPDKASLLARKARTRAIDNFSLEVITKKYIHLYESII